jgi:hypothetical protein
MGDNHVAKWSYKSCKPLQTNLVQVHIMTQFAIKDHNQVFKWATNPYKLVFEQIMA